VGAAERVLSLMEILRRDRVLHINAAARELGVAPSTAHRLAQTLLLRGYAVQRPDRSYGPGPMLPPDSVDTVWTRLRSHWRPALEAISGATAETVHLIVRDGDSVVFLDSVLPKRALEVGSRAGIRMPAERNSGGKALLARLPTASMQSLYAGRHDVGTDALQESLAAVRRRGFGISVAEYERGITAIGVPVRDADLVPVAIAVSGPSLRFDRSRAVAALPVLQRVVEQA